MCVETLDRNNAGEPGAPTGRALRVGVAGLGTIGEGAALRLLADANYTLAGALVQNPAKHREALPDDLPITDDPARFLQFGCDVIVDALPVGDAGHRLIDAALSRGVSVVTANKQAVAGSLRRFTDLAEANDAVFAYAAAVGGGAPMTQTVREAAAEGVITEMSAILNGTVNYILSALGEGENFDDAVRRAQDARFAEPDPTADLSGDDARAKIAILSFDAFGEEIPLDAIETTALDAALAARIAEDTRVWKQVSTIMRTGDTASAVLRIEPVDAESFLAGVRGEGNALRVLTDAGQTFTCEGKGAGRAPTVASLFSDLDALRVGAAPTSVD